MAAGTTLVFVGPAGSGKTSLVAAYSEWLREGGASVYTVNLDPAVKVLPYEPGFDARRLVSVDEVARKYGLGPNGALVKAMELLAERVEEVAAAVAEADADYVLVDTPGQMEVFLFRDISWRLVEALEKVSQRVYAVFILDATVLRDPADYAFLLLMATAVQLRLGVETAPVINKADLAPDVEATGDLLRDYGRVSKSLRESGGVYGEMLRELLRGLLKYSRRVNVPRVSAAKREGLEELHRLVLEMGCSCGDLT